MQSTEQSTEHHTNHQKVPRPFWHPLFAGIMLGIVLLGNFDQQSPAAAQLIALSNFMVYVRGLYGVPLVEVHTHGELGKTGCPGQRLQAFMNRIRQKWARES